MNNNKRKYSSVIPETDEGWWESVLAEEEQHAAIRPQMAAKPVKPAAQSDEVPEASPPPAPTVDWDAARKLYAEDGIITLKVTGHNHGGLLVENNGLAGFVPFSHLVELAGREHDASRDACLDGYTGKTLNVKMIECVPEDGRLVFSERAALTAPGKRTELFHTLQAGDQVTGTVTNITDFGVFIDLGGVEGLIHLSELSWGRVTHPRNIVGLGQAITVLVLDVSVERNRVALSLKRLTSNPWERAETDFPVGMVQPAVVTTVLSYGAFARLEAGIEGLIHASEMPLAENQSPRDLLTEGQLVQARVLHVDPAHQRLGLSMKLNPA
jgi:small subunit ribosomal protein S1